MANKLTSEKLKELIKEVLKEEKQQLDEININIPSHIGDIRKDFGFGKKTNLSSGTSYQKQKSDIQSLGALDKDNTDVTDTDLETAFNNNSWPEFDVADWLRKNSTVTNVKNAAQDAYDKVKVSPPPPHSGGTLLNKYGLTTSSTKTAIKNAILKITSKGSSASLQDQKDAQDLNDYLFTLYKSNPNNNSAYHKCKKAINKMLGTPPKSTNFNTALAAFTSSFQDIEDIPPDTLAGDLPMGGRNTPGDAAANTQKMIDDSLNAFTSAPMLPEHVTKTFALFTPDIVKVWQEMGEVASAISKKSFPSKRKDALNFIAKANLVIKLGNMSKKFSESAAGFQFEQFCASLFQGMNIGGFDGAIDVFTKMANGTYLFTSQKYLAEDGAVTQSGSKKYGLSEVFSALQARNMPEEVYYFTARKQGGTTDYTAINIYLAKVTPKGTTGGGKGNYSVAQYDPATGNFVPITSGSQANNKLSISAANLNIPVATIPLLNKASDSATAIAEYTVTQMKSGSGPIAIQIEAIQNILQKLQNLESLTTAYTATAQNATDAQNYVDRVADSYVTLSTGGFEKLFTKGEKTKAKVSGQQVFKENKKSQTKSIKDLDKLIERVILESMNKK